uniref:Ribosomal protein S16 n=1 Tax=Phlegmariurus carinatus TaxID=380491 RepID=A0A7G7XPR3_PHLCA|nr:ribosomal protein S16 [Phlegmariurus carinatus]QNH82403.1 ribosomal protein S16 [Phlegmariurus carinatus]WBV80300.1 ribosomal protein S16 [Phlegmariurus squarrosus]
MSHMMSPVFGPIQLFFYYPFFSILFYVYLTVYPRISNVINITNITNFLFILIRWMKNRYQ